MEQRRNAIVELVNREGSLSFVQLKKAFPSVSEMTLRTDLKALDQARRVVRVHGGVKSVEVVVGTDDQFGRRTARNASEKQIIAEKAAALLRPNTTVFLDSGSTATAVARCVPDEPMLIFTSGLTCAIELARLEKPKVSIPGRHAQPVQPQRVRRARHSGTGGRAFRPAAARRDELQSGDRALPAVSRRRRCSSRLCCIARSMWRCCWIPLKLIEEVHSAFAVSMR